MSPTLIAITAPTNVEYWYLTIWLCFIYLVFITPWLPRSMYALICSVYSGILLCSRAWFTTALDWTARTAGATRMPSNRSWLCTDILSVNSHLVHSQLKIDVTPIIDYISYTPWWERATVTQSLNTNLSRTETPTKQRYSKKLPSRELSGLGKPINVFFLL